MNELRKTLAFVTVAGALVALATFVSWPTAATTPAAFNDQGQHFFKEFDPLAATNLEVTAVDPDTARARLFQVMLKNGRWVIPSHYDYPADARDRLARTAAGLNRLTKDVIVSDRPEDHKDLGVIDPYDKKSTTTEGMGKRVTLRDKSGNVLADLILGKEVKDRAGMVYARHPDQNRTYGVVVKAEISTRFADWIEPNLLKLDAAQLRRVVFDNHKVDPDRGRLIPGEVLTIERKEASGPWQMAGLAPDQEVNTDKVSTLTSALSDLKIVGVRPMPAGLTADLKAASSGATFLPTNSQAARSLVQRGFYPTDRGLFSNEGEVRASTEDGVVYTLRFGEVIFAEGEALSAGKEEAKKGQGKGKAEAKKDVTGAVESRFLFATAHFDKALIPPPAPPKADRAGDIPSDPFSRTPKERADQAKEAKEKADREKADYDRKVADGQKKAKELTDRFSGWYYVVPGDAYRSIELDRSALVRKKGEGRPEGPDAPGGTSPFGGFPGGFPGGGIPNPHGPRP